MSHQFNDELISAYLDGELTAEEQALVEQVLNESTEHQQMLGELSALRESFQILPTYKLDERFGERVLRAAERHMLADSNVPNSIPPSGNASVELPAPSTVAMDDRRGWRMAIGSVAAVAALVLVTLFLASLGDQDTNESLVSHHEQKNTGDEKAEQIVEQSGADDASTGKNSSNKKAGSHLTFDESAENDAKTDNFSPRSIVVGQKQAPVAAPALNNTGEGSSVPSQAEKIAPMDGAYGGFGGGAGNNRATLGGRNNLALDLNDSPDVIAMDEENMRYDDSSLADFYDYFVVIDVPKDKRLQQPVQLALESLNVHEALLAEYSSEAEKQLQSDQATETKSRSYNSPNESKVDEIHAAGEADVVSEDLLVVATEDQVKAVCDTLKRQGLIVTLHGNQLGSVSAESLVRKRELRRDTVGRSRTAVNREADPVESEKSNESSGRVDRKSEPSAEKADADKFADAVDAPSPAPAAPAGRPKDSEYRGNEYPGKAPGAKPATAPAKPKVRRSVSSASKLKEDKEDEKLAAVEPTDKRSAIVEEDGTRKPDSQLSRKLSESQRLKSPSSYYRPLSVNNQLGQLKEAAKQQAVPSSGELELQRLAKGTASRGVSGPAEDSPTDSAGAVTATLSSTSPRVKVRFIIRTVDLPASATAAEEPASKK